MKAIINKIKILAGKEWSKASLTILIFLFLFVVFNTEIMTLFNKIIVPILSSANEGVFSSILFVSLVIVLLVFWYKRFRRFYYVTPICNLGSIVLSLIYWYYRLFTSDYVITSSDLMKIGFTDIIFGGLFCFGLISIFVVWADVKPQKASSKDNQSDSDEEPNEETFSLFVEDRPIKRSDEDELHFGEDVNGLFNQINNRKDQSSFSIGINARWGDGKSSFINLLIEKFRENEEHFIVIQFNPRHAPNGSIQASFFEMLFSELSKYDSRFTHSFNDYLRVIDVMADNQYLSAIFKTTRLLNRKSEKDKINEAIKRLKKRIIVIIEDLDRLMADEIIEVFKLIDGNASFNNLIFISAYDKIRIQSLIKQGDDKDVNNDYGAYSDKFFTYERILPLRSHESLLGYLSNNLTKGIRLKNEDKEEIKRIITNDNSFFKTYLHNLRDVKRYINIVKPSLVEIYGELKIGDYLLIELVRYRCPQEYRLLFEQNEHKVNAFNLKQAIIIDDVENYKSKDILKVLFPDDGSTSFRSINSVGAFSIYFHDHLFEHLSMKTLKAMFEKDIDYKAVIKNVFDNGHKDVLIEYLSSLNVLSQQNWDDVIRYLDIYIHLNARYNENLYSTINVSSLLEEQIAKDLCKRHNLEMKEYKNLLYQKLIGEYPEYPFEISKQQLWAYKSGEIKARLVFSDVELMDILKKSLKDLIEHEPNYSTLHNKILRSCISSIDPISRKVTLDPEACEWIRQSIELKPDKFIDKFVFLGATSSSPDWNNIVCEPFWKQIFGDKDKMKNFIYDKKLNSITNIERARNFWKLYENNGYEAIEFQNQGPVKEKIENNLVSEVEMLNEILSIESQINSLVISEETLKSSEKTLKSISDKLMVNTLYIKKRGEVLQLIKDKFNELDHFKETK
ncbi:MAG: hypothetical protein J6B92_08245 [Paraprevotella sp.]|nr:hypothetical protein [Paraprevotella sp.]